MSRVLPVVEVMNHEVLSFRIEVGGEEIMFNVDKESGKFENIRGDKISCRVKHSVIITSVQLDSIVGDYGPYYKEKLVEQKYDKYCKKMNSCGNNTFKIYYNYGYIDEYDDYGFCNNLEFMLDENLRLVNGDIDYINRFRKTKSARNIACC